MYISIKKRNSKKLRRNARTKKKEKNTKKEGRAERIMSCNFGQKVKGEEKEKKKTREELSK